MKKKFKNKLVFNKTTVADLSSQEQQAIRGGTDPVSCWTWKYTYCGTCFTDCGQQTCAGPTCFDTCPPLQCTDLDTICNKPCPM